MEYRSRHTVIQCSGIVHPIDHCESCHVQTRMGTASLVPMLMFSRTFRSMRFLQIKCYCIYLETLEHVPVDEVTLLLS